jgi:hypothetical protein
MSCVVWASLQFNIVLDKGLEKQKVQFNNVPVAYEEMGLLWVV